MLEDDGASLPSFAHPIETYVFLSEHFPVWTGGVI
jgi:hypothetical protein